MVLLLHLLLVCDRGPLRLSWVNPQFATGTIAPHTSGGFLFCPHEVVGFTRGCHLLNARRPLLLILLVSHRLNDYRFTLKAIRSISEWISRLGLSTSHELHHVCVLLA